MRSLDVVRFAGDGLAAGHEGLDLAQLHGSVAAFVALDDAMDKVALLCFVFFEDRFAFDFFEALDEELLGGGGGDASELFGGHDFGRRVWPA